VPHHTTPDVTTTNLRPPHFAACSSNLPTRQLANSPTRQLANSPTRQVVRSSGRSQNAAPQQRRMRIMERQTQSRHSPRAVPEPRRAHARCGDLAVSSIQACQRGASRPRGLAGIVAPTSGPDPSSGLLRGLANHAATQLGQLGTGSLDALGRHRRARSAEAVGVSSVLWQIAAALGVRGGAGAPGRGRVVRSPGPASAGARCLIWRTLVVGRPI